MLISFPCTLVTDKGTNELLTLITNVQTHEDCSTYLIRIQLNYTLAVIESKFTQLLAYMQIVTYVDKIAFEIILGNIYLAVFSNLLVTLAGINTC